MHKTFLTLASLLGALSVALGAFGAHGLKKIVPAETVSTFQTGVQYQFYHTFALFLAAILYKEFPSNNIVWAGYAFIAGILLFSGSLYVLTFLHDTQSVGLKRIGIITPVGGLFFIAGWVLLAMGLKK
ncbi:MAG: DUF423 domain-containing protein [Chitinophagaceae bacterium]